jgi:hypothetical protein
MYTEYYTLDSIKVSDDLEMDANKTSVQYCHQRKQRSKSFDQDANSLSCFLTDDSILLDEELSLRDHSYSFDPIVQKWDKNPLYSSFICSFYQTLETSVDSHTVVNEEEEEEEQSITKEMNTRNDTAFSHLHLSNAVNKVIDELLFSTTPNPVPSSYTHFSHLERTDLFEALRFYAVLPTKSHPEKSSRLEASCTKSIVQTGSKELIEKEGLVIDYDEHVIMDVAYSYAMVRPPPLTLILDLDETLVHCAVGKLDPCDFRFSIHLPGRHDLVHVWDLHDIENITHDCILGVCTLSSFFV